MRLRFSPRAYADIADIYNYIEQHNPRAAAAVVAQIRLTSLLLARYPALGRETDIPVFACYPYLVYHKVEQEDLVVIHVRHGRRDTATEDEL